MFSNFRSRRLLENSSGPVSFVKYVKSSECRNLRHKRVTVKKQGKSLAEHLYTTYVILKLFNVVNLWWQELIIENLLHEVKEKEREEKICLCVTA